MARAPTTVTAVTVTNAGTRVALTSTTTFCSILVLEADALNTGNIYWGGSTVSSTNGNTLVKGQNVSISYEIVYGANEKIDLSQIYVDADTNGNKCRVTYFPWSGG